MVDKVFLTEKRRDVLNGESDLDGNSLSVAKSRIRKRAKLALDELIEVAESEEIDNEDLFDPNDVAPLIHALMVDGESITPRWNWDGDAAEYREEYAYQLALQSRLGHTIGEYDDLLRREQAPSAGYGSDPWD